MSGHREPRSIVSGTLYCILLVYVSTILGPPGQESEITGLLQF